MLNYPDWNTPFEVHCDASDVGAAAKLCQRVDGVERVVMYASKSLSPAEKRYFAYEKEALAMVWALDLFRHYLKYKPFVVITDCRSLVYLKEKALNARIGRWMLRLQEFEFSIKHKAGVLIQDVDTLSRAPLEGTNPYGEEPMEELYDEDPTGPSLLSKADTAFKKEHQASVHIIRVLQPLITAAEQATKDESGEFSPEPLFLRVVTRRQGKSGSQKKQPEKTTRTDSRPADVPVEDSVQLEEKEQPQRAFFKCAADLEGWDVSTWVKEQRDARNTEVARLLKFLEDNPANPNYKIQANGLLVKISLDASAGPRVVVPETLKAFILRLHHNMPLHAHQGGKRLIKMLSAKFYWTNMNKDALRWVQSCSCVKRKTPRPLSQGLTEPIQATRPLEVVGIDLVGKCLETTRGHKWILTIVDHYTRWPIAIPLPDRKATTIARALYEHVICQYGVPRKILSDQGKELIGDSLEFLYKRWGVKRVKTGGYNPQANGACERFHRWLHTAMSQLYDRKSPDWDECIPAALFAYRVSVNDATGHSPHLLMHGREATLPSDIIFDPESESSTGHDYDSYVAKVAERLRQALDTARKSQYKAYLDNYDRAPARVKPALTKGDSVLVWRKSSKETRLELAGDKRALPSKWVNPWTGPAKFIRELNNTSCEVELDGKVLPMNYNRVVKFTPWDETNSSTDIWSRDHEREGSEEPARKRAKYDDISSGDVILFGLNDGTSNKNAYAVAKALSVNNGWIHFQWLGNYSNSKERVFLPGWIDPRDNREYYSRKQIHPSHVKFTGTDTETFIDTSRVILKGSALIKESGKLTAYALDLISKLENNCALF